MKLLFYIMVFMLLLGTSFSSSPQYDFMLEFDHDFDENEDIECEVIFDDRDKNLDFDEDSESDDFIYENDFEKTLEVSCDSNVDDIEVSIFDERGSRVDKFDYEDSKGFEYELDLVDEEDTWFSLLIDHRFSSSEEIDCELEIDSNDYDYEFNSQSDNYNIAMNYKDTIEFSCDDDLDSVELKVYDDRELLVFEELFEDDDSFEFESIDLEDVFEIRLEFNHDFDDNEEIICDIEIDDSNDIETLVFDDDSSSRDTIFIDDILEVVTVECDEDVDEIELLLYDEGGELVDEEYFEDDDSFTYNVKEGDYLFLILLEHTFGSDEEIICQYVRDSEFDSTLIFDEDSSILDKRISGSFDVSMELSCDSNLRNVEFFVYEDEDSKENIYETSLQLVDTITYSFEEENPIVDETSSNNEQENLTDIVDEENIIDDEEVMEEETNISVESEQDSELSSINTSLDLESQNNVDVIVVDDKEVSTTLDTNSQNSSSLSEEEGSSSFSVIFLLVLFICILIYIVFLHKEVLFSKKDKRVKDTKKKDIDFSFLQKKK